MKTKTSLILLIVLFGLGGLALWDEERTVLDTQEKLNSKRIIKIDKSLVNKIHWLEKKKDNIRKSFTLKKNDDELNWEILEPIESLVDKKRIKSYLDSLIEYKFTKKINASRQKWEEFGVGDDARQIEIFYKKGKKNESITLYIGNNLPVGYSTYIRVGGEDSIFVGSQYLSVLTSSTHIDFRKKTFIDLSLEELTSFSYKVKGYSEIKIEKNNHQFSIIKPDAYEASQGEVSAFLIALSAMKAVGFYDKSMGYKELERLQKIEPKYIFQWKEDQEIIFNFYKMEGHLWASDDLDTVAYRLTPDSEKILDRSILSFRNRRIFEFDSENINEVIVDGTMFVVKNDKWSPLKEENDENLRLNSEQIRSLLIDLEFAKTSRFIKIDEYLDVTIEDPIHIISLKEGENDYIRINFWVLNGNLLVQVDDSQMLYEISSKIFEFENKEMKKISNK